MAVRGERFWRALSDPVRLLGTPMLSCLSCCSLTGVHRQISDEEAPVGIAQNAAWVCTLIICKSSCHDRTNLTRSRHAVKHLHGTQAAYCLYTLPCQGKTATCNALPDTLRPPCSYTNVNIECTLLDHQTPALTLDPLLWSIYTLMLTGCMHHSALLLLDAVYR